MANSTPDALNARVGIIELVGRLPPIIALLPPGQGSNNSIWLFKSMPVPGLTMPEWMFNE